MISTMYAAICALEEKRRALTMSKRIRMLLLVVVLGAVCLSLVGSYLPAGIGGFVATVEAVIGRPLTPLSVAGVARRTARRCRAGIYC